MGLGQFADLRGGGGGGGKERGGGFCGGGGGGVKFSTQPLHKTVNVCCNSNPEIYLF